MKKGKKGQESLDDGEEMDDEDGEEIDDEDVEETRKTRRHPSPWRGAEAPRGRRVKWGAEWRLPVVVVVVALHCCCCCLLSPCCEMKSVF